jgi:hypothetical protein
MTFDEWWNSSQSPKFEAASAPMMLAFREMAGAGWNAAIVAALSQPSQWSDEFSGRVIELGDISDLIFKG